MNTRQLNAAIWSAAAILACAGAGVLAVGIVAPLRPAQSSVSFNAGSGKADGERAGTDLPAMDSFEPLFTRPLRVALTDASAAGPVAAAPAPATAAAAPLVLVGTIGQSLAMIKTPDGEVAVKGVGDQVNGAEVLAIRPTQVDLRVGGKTITLEKPVETSDNP